MEQLQQQHPKQRSKSRSRKQSNVVIGRKVVEGQVSWRGADLTTNRYIGNIHINTSVIDVKAAIESAGVEVVELEELALQHKRHKSFRLRLKKSDINKIENPDFLPQGVVVRGFFRGKSHTADGAIAIQAALS